MTKENLYNAIAIFLSIIGSFGVERIIEYRSEQNQIELLENNLIHELEQNYYSLISLRGTLNSVIEVSDSITMNWSTINSEKIKSFHSNSLYDINERIEFILSSSYGLSTKNMYLNSLINSGLILKIKSSTLRNQIESVNLLIKGGYMSSNDLIENNIRQWFIKYSNAEESLNNDLIFNKYKDFELLQFLTLRRRNEVYKLSGVNGNINFLEEIINEVKEKGLF